MQLQTCRPLCSPACPAPPPALWGALLVPGQGQRHPDAFPPGRVTHPLPLGLGLAAWQSTYLQKEPLSQVFRDPLLPEQLCKASGK